MTDEKKMVMCPKCPEEIDGDSHYQQDTNNWCGYHAHYDYGHDHIYETHKFIEINELEASYTRELCPVFHVYRDSANTKLIKKLQERNERIA